MNKRRSIDFWRRLSVFLISVLVIQLAVFVGWRLGAFDGFLVQGADATAKRAQDGFEAFESIAFAREFSERFLTFGSYNFNATQTALAFLLADDARGERLSEIDRLREKIEKRDVNQRAKLLTLVQWPNEPEHFRAELLVELEEGAGESVVKNQFSTKLEFRIQRAERTAQNPWGFLVSDLKYQPVEAVSATPLTATLLSLRPETSLLVRFPCSIENVELPKGTSIRVKLTTLDISELQMTSSVPLESDQTLKAICRDRIFSLKIHPDAAVFSNPLEPRLVLKFLTMDESTSLSEATAVSKLRLNKNKSPGEKRIQKSIEEQLGFIVED